ncbi:MAG: chromosomal replication initiator protein DnaA [Candidatus Paceibacterota bacterium]|jgi:chromosomal replication initiator protein|nr:chromosomal replication initiator protein DnaA [Candidatus Paceibacterota bacterium]
MDNKQLWDSVLAEVELTVSRANFSTWFKNTRIIKHENGIVYVGLPNEFVKEWLYSKYDKFILKTLRNISEGVRGVEYVIVTPTMKEKSQDSSPSRTGQPYVQELPLSDLYINKEDNLNPRYTFDTLVIGSFNELAYAATQAVVKHPGQTYNPLFIHGGVGLGKTHIAQAVGNKLKEEKSGKKIYYITSEKFSMDYINSVQNNRVHDFKEKYRKYDVFIMDDIQFLSGKEKTQEELFHLFNILYENNKQIIFSSDRHPNHIHGLEDRLKSRFGAGMIVDITTPEYESRMAIIRRKIQSSNFSLNDDSVKFIAESLECSIRELEGIINSIICQARLKNRELQQTEIKLLIKNNIIPKKTASIKDVIKVVSEFYHIDESAIYEKTRRKEIVKPRQIAMYLLREDFTVSYPTIGEKFGGRDHTTVIHSCDKIKSSIKDDDVLVEELSQIRALL